MSTQLPRITRPEPPAAPAPAPLRVQSLAEVLAEARAFYHEGLGNGETTHWPCLDEYWTWLPKEITVVTGNANHGKSRFIHSVMLLKAAFSKPEAPKRFAVYVPENEDDFFVELAQQLVGRTANRKFERTRMDWEALEAAITWLHQHFVVVTAPDGTTPALLLAEFARLHAKNPLYGVLIDPWNQLDHDWQAREDVYLSNQFGLLKRFAIRHELAVVVTAHPAGQAKDKHGNLVRPDAYSIAGGKMWNNKFDNVLAVFRPDFPKPDVELWVHKIKKRGRVGQPGMLELTYELPSSRYFPTAGDPRHPLETRSINAPGAESYADVHVGPALIRSLPASTFEPDENDPF